VEEDHILWASGRAVRKGMRGVLTMCTTAGKVCTSAFLLPPSKIRIFESAAAGQGSQQGGTMCVSSDEAPPRGPPGHL
jgi:hypothetical protein